MLKIISGVPGSGKTYWAVNYISDFAKKHVKDNPGQPLSLLHNIEGLKLGKTFAAHEEETGLSIHKLFTFAYHETDKTYRGFLFVIDEAQSLFRKGFKNPDTLLFFEKHRHLGIDLILLTQDIKLLSQEVSVHCELHLRAASDTANPFPWLFLYLKMVGWESIGREWVRKKQSVFDLYKTADFDQDKVRKKSRPMFVLFIFLGLCVPAFGVYLFTDWVGGKKESSEKYNEERGVAERPITDIQDTIRARADNQMKEKQPQQNVQSLSPYPQSIQDHFQGVPMKLNYVIQGSRKIIFLGDVMFSETEFPFPILETQTGHLVSIVPLDVYEYQKNLVTQRKQFDNIDPNQKYYYQGATNDRSSTRTAQSGGNEAGAGGLLVY